jgi:dTDP-4-amino-4,6-dideoxygalactose transaminase
VIPLSEPNLSGNEARYLRECIETNFVSSVGPFVDRFEALVATAVGAREAVATSSGTTGLHAALTAVGVGRDDLVILPSFTFIASANAVSHCGASPWLLDIDRSSWTIDPEGVAEAVREETERRGEFLVHRVSGRRVAAMMPVYTLGTPADMDPLVDLARRHGIPIVADAAAALGARYRGRTIAKTGADLTVFSFNGNKTVTAGGGGAVAGDDELLCRRVRHLTTTARVGADYTHDMVGFNYRMTNLQAAVGCAQIEHLDEFVTAKRRIARRYDEVLGELPGVKPVPHPDWAESACWFSAVTVASPPVSELVPRLQAEGIGCRPFWKPVHQQNPYHTAPRSPQPVCEELWHTVLTLPCSTHLSDADQEKVIAAVRAAVGGQSPE